MPHKAKIRLPLCFPMRVSSLALALLLVPLAAACNPATNEPVAFGQVDPSEFRQPLPEPRLQKRSDAPAASRLLSQLASSIRSARFQIVGTEMASRPQGQIGAQVYHLDGVLTTRTPAMELKPWEGSEYDIDGRGDFIVVGSTIYVRGNTFTEWQTIAAGDPYWGVFADINPALWVGSNESVLGEAFLDGSPTWVLQLTNEFGLRFKAWIREKDGYPLRYTAAWLNAKGSTYYVNALYREFNTTVQIDTPEMLNRGVANPGAPVALPSGSVTVTEVEFDCLGTTSRRPATHDKFVLLTLAFVDTGPGQVPVSPDAWRLYGDGVNGAAPIETGSPQVLRAQVLSPGDRVSGAVVFEVPEDAYQLITVGHLVGATAVMSAGLPILPNGTLPCT